MVDTKDVHDVIRGSSAKAIPEFSVSAKSKKKPAKELSSQKAAGKHVAKTQSRASIVIDEKEGQID